MSVLPFVKVLRDVSRGVRKVPKREFLTEGRHPIVDQGQQLIAGFCNSDEGLCTTVPAIVFGDHTRCVKFIEEPFVAGADGVKILAPVRNDDNPRYLYHILRNANIPNLGYSRHFKLVKELNFVVPSRRRQDEIVKHLEAIENQRSKAEEQLGTLDELVKARFVEMFGSGEWPIIKSDEFFYGIRNGVSPSRNGNHHETVLTLSAITQGSFDTSACKEDSFKAKPPEDKRVMAYDFYMCRGNGNKALVGAGEFATKDRRDLVFPDTVIAAHVDRSRVDLAYLRETWRQPYVREQIESMAKTTNGTYKVNQTMVKSIQLKIPPLALQQEFAAFVARVDQLKADTQLAIDKLQMLYDSLAQEYLSE